jgi:hypothetical protein
MADNIQFIDVDINEHLGSGVNVEYLSMTYNDRLKRDKNKLLTKTINHT